MNTLNGNEETSIKPALMWVFPISRTTCLFIKDTDRGTQFDY